MLNTKYYLVRNQKEQYGVMRVWTFLNFFKYALFLDLNYGSRIVWRGQNSLYFSDCWIKSKEEALESFKVAKNGYWIIEELS